MMDDTESIKIDSMDEIFTDSDNQENTFAQIEADYNKLMLTLCDDPALSKYADAYTALFDYAYGVHVKSLNLQNTKQQLEEEYNSTEQRLVETSQVLIKDSHLISSLKNQVQISHKLLDTAHEQEQAAMEVIDNLRHTITSLQGEIEFKNKMTVVEDDENPTVAKHRQGLEREREKLLKEVARMNEKFETALEYQEELEQRTDQTDAQIHDVIEQLEDATNELQKNKRVKERLELELEDLSEDVQGLTKYIREKTTTVSADQHVVVKLENDLKEQILSSSKCINELAIWNQRYCKMADDLNQVLYSANTEKREHLNLNRRLGLQTHEQDMIKKDIELRTMQKHAALATNERMLLETEKAIKDRNQTREAIAQQEAIVMNQKMLNDTSKREIVNRIREKDMISRNLTRQHAITNTTIQHIALQQGERKKTEYKIDAQVEQQKQQKRHMAFLERERDRLKEDAVEKANQIEDLMDELKAQKLHMFDSKKRLLESQNKLQMQHNAFDACRSDKRFLEKTLRQNMSQAQALKNKVYDYTRNNELIKNEVFYKEQETQACANYNKLLVVEVENMRQELVDNTKEIHELKEAIAYHKMFTKDLLLQIEQADFKLREDDKTIATFINERDVLSAQLVRRNEELALLYRKMHLLKTMLEYGEAQYSRRLDDLTLLKREIMHIRQNKSVYEKKISNMNDFKAEVLALEKDLTRERVKSMRLRAEMHSPMNIHRWSKLEGSDPDMFNLMRKILLMQKRVLRHSDEINARGLQLKEMKKLYKTMRKMAAKQPGPNIHQRMRSISDNLKESKMQSRYLTNERKETEDEFNRCSLQLKTVSLELRKERQKLLNEKKMRRRNMQNLRRMEAYGQEVMNSMAKLISDRTILTIAMKTSDTSMT